MKSLPTILEFAAYVRVERRGRWPMYHPRAQKATGLSDAVFIDVIAHLPELAKRYPNVARGELG